MLSRTFAVGLLALGCVTAAAGGAYVAVRQSAVSTPDVSAQTVGPARNETGSPAVHETEAVITSPQPVPEPELLERAELSPSDRQVAPRASRPARARPSAAGTVARRAPVSSPRAAAPNPPVAPVAPAAAPSFDPAAATAARTEPPAVPPTVEIPRHDTAPVAPTRIFDELVVPASSVIGLQVETPVSSERARVEDRVEARVQRDVSVDGRTAIPAGARAIGAVTIVERGGKVKERARLGVRFHTLVLADGTELPMRTEAILREGDSPGGDSARKIGGAAVGGAILGAILGGKKGAIVGGATGAAGGSAVVMAGDRQAATLPVGAVVTVRLSAPVSVEVERR